MTVAHLGDRERAWRACVGLAVLAATTRAGLAATRPQVFLDRMFVPDDTYYTLTIARSMARALGPSVDGGRHLTSGFQPLVAFLLVPILKVTDDPELAFRAALAIGALADGVTALLLGVLATRLAGPRSGVIATALWALSTAAIATSLNGLETSLAMACVGAALVLFTHALATTRGRGGFVALGAALGACLLARVDTIFLVAPLGIVVLSKRGVRELLTTAATAALVVAPWWLYSLAHFGTIVPESGAAVRAQALAYRDLGLNIRDQIAWASAAVLGPPLFDTTALRQFLGGTASAIGFALGISIVVGALVIARWRPRDPSAPQLALRSLAVFVAALFLFYAFYLPATWFMRRYLAPFQMFTTLCCALGAAVLMRKGRGGVVAAVMGFSVVLSLAAIVRFATMTPAMTIDVEHHGAKGYLEPARQMLAIAPEGAVIGSLQSGALVWVAETELPRDGKTVHVVNLDGVVDREAGIAYRERRLAELARSRGVTHFCDWDFNMRTFLDRSGDPRLGRASFHAIGTPAEPQGKDERFRLYAIEWP